MKNAEEIIKKEWLEKGGDNTSFIRFVKRKQLMPGDFVLENQQGLVNEHFYWFNEDILEIPSDLAEKIKSNFIRVACAKKGSAFPTNVYDDYVEKLYEYVHQLDINFLDFVLMGDDGAFSYKANSRKPFNV